MQEEASGLGTGLIWSGAEDQAGRETTAHHVGDRAMRGWSCERKRSGGRGGAVRDLVDRGRRLWVWSC